MAKPAKISDPMPAPAIPPYVTSPPGPVAVSRGRNALAIAMPPPAIMTQPPVRARLEAGPIGRGAEPAGWAESPRG